MLKNHSRDKTITTRETKILQALKNFRTTTTVSKADLIKYCVEKTEVLENIKLTVSLFSFNSLIAEAKSSWIRTKYTCILLLIVLDLKPKLCYNHTLSLSCKKCILRLNSAHVVETYWYANDCLALFNKAAFWLSEESIDKSRWCQLNREN